MKINSIKEYTIPHFSQQTSKTKNKQNSNLKKAAPIIASATAITSGIIVIGIIKKAPKKPINIDIDFKNSILKSLEKEGIKCKTEDLNSIVGPEEFSTLINKFKPENFNISKQAQSLDKFKNEGEFINYLKDANNLKDYYSNFVDGTFRVNLHSHSNFSDGRASVSEFLENATKYADLIASKNSDKSIPPFTIALTDHDNVDGCKEAIKIIAQNPKKYKNLKFVAGTEMSVNSNILEPLRNHFDVTALAINPFDNDFCKLLNDLKDKRTNTIQKLIDKSNLRRGTNYTINDLIDWQLKNSHGKQDIKTMAGVSGVRHAIDALMNISSETIKKSHYDHCDSLDLETVINAIHKAGGKASLTHPLKSFYAPIPEEKLMKLKELGIDGFEANHQYAPNKFYKLMENNHFNPDDSVTKRADIIYNNLSDFAKKNSLFLSGGTDSHNHHPFIYHPNNDFVAEFVENVLNGKIK